MSEPRPPFPLPLVTGRPERGDAAANRERILCAARTLLEANGPNAVSMDAVASTAGVGKGTVFRRFGDRAGMMAALISDYMRDFQDQFLAGPPPLGPGAPPAERLEAFISSLISLQREHMAIAIAAEFQPAAAPTGVYGALRLHVSALLNELDPTLQADIVSSMILGAIAPPVLNQLHADSEKITSSATALLRGLTCRRGSPVTLNE